ncbi:TPA: hypothetical protein QDZ42_001364 [Stenotrophomonas maltophilia]|nr:hypothetical protein [Stenotrophomonas maltophilia]HDS1042725.1 hypothetical protein [Stenotrophomonas maltophilia]
MGIDVPFPLLACLISLMALWVAVRNYQRKRGLDMRASFSVSSNIDCEDVYVSSLIIENVKDRACVIFAIYLQVGRSLYVNLVDFGDAPLLIKPFEAYAKDLGPIEHYQANFSRFNINELMRSRDVRKRLVCSTSEGRYAVPSRMKRWDPLMSSFSNILAGVIYPQWSEYKGLVVGGKVKYIVELSGRGSDSQKILLRSDSYGFKTFHKFNLTKDSLSSSASLREFLAERKEEGGLGSLNFEVIDVEASRQQRFSQFGILEGDPVVLKEHSFWSYHFVGRWLAWRSKRQER